MMKSLLTVLLAAFAILASNAQSLILSKNSDWVKINGRGSSVEKNVDGEAILVLNGVANFSSKEMLKIDPSKLYKLTGEFMAKPGTVPAKLYFGFLPYDEQKNQLLSERIYAFPGTETELAEDVKAGDTVIKLRDCSKWKVNGGYLAMNIKDDYSDLPNSAISPRIQSREKVGEIYILKLAKPMTQAYAKGTKVRQHNSAGTYHYAAVAGAMLNNENWRTFSVTINGEALKKYGIQSKKWWHGTRYVKIIILGNYGGKADSVTYFRNVKLEELTR